MDHRAEVRAFLKARRARIAPETVGFSSGDKRRVPGLRREEVALLAGVSVDYYIRIERGDLRGVSDEVLMAIARALQLNGRRSSTSSMPAIGGIRPAAAFAYELADPVRGRAIRGRYALRPLPLVA
jgi:transcriptional regulator with XRE-family HTH domain